MAASKESKRVHPIWTCGVGLVALFLFGAAFSMFVLAYGPLAVLCLVLAIVTCVAVGVGAVVQHVAASRTRKPPEAAGKDGGQG